MTTRLPSEAAHAGSLYCPQCEQWFTTGTHCPTDGTKFVTLAAPIDPLLGRDLDGRYTMLERIGHGGMGAVYRSNQHSVGREVAIKVVKPSLVSEPETIRRFLREAKLASKLNHPNAVGIVDFGRTDDGVFYLVMELVVGKTLAELISLGTTFSPGRIVRIARQVCDALEAAHAMSIVHRDLKPANIMLLSGHRDFVTVLDFGLAKSLSTDATTTTMSGTGQLLGTPAFMPPELACGAPCDGRADLYSLGCVLYLMGSGHLPFKSISPHELIAMHGTEHAPPMTGVPASLAAVVDRLLAKDPQDRYQSAAETREALEDALGELRVSMHTPIPGELTLRGRRTPTEIDQLIREGSHTAPPEPIAAPPEPIAAAPSRRRWLWLVGAAAAIAVCVAVAIALWPPQVDRPAAPRAEPAAQPAAQLPPDAATERTDDGTTNGAAADAPRPQPAPPAKRPGKPAKAKPAKPAKPRPGKDDDLPF